MFYKLVGSPVHKQYLIVITVNLIIFSVGLGLAWPSPMLVKLWDTNEPALGRPITEDEGAWIVSVGFLVGAILNFVPSILLSKIGFKYSILIGMFPKVLGCFLMVFGTEVWMLILARALSGISYIFAFTVVPMYASEIASKEIRGSLSTVLQVMSSLGIVIMLSIGPFIPYLAVNVLQLAVVVASLIPIPFLPEGPYFLYRKKRTNESLEVLTLLHGSEKDVNEILKEYAINDTEEKVNKLEVFKNKLFWKSLFLVCILVIGAQLIGFNAVSFYLQSILKSTQTSMNPEISSVIIGLLQLSASLFTAFSTDKFGRKPILSLTLIGMMIGMICLGVFFYVTEGAEEVIGFMNFLPLIALILVIFCFSAGTGSLNWALTAELFDNKGRTVGLPISMVISGLSVFFVTRYFPVVMAAVGPVATYWGFSVNCLLLCAFIMIFIPETKGKTYTEIQRALGAKINEDEEKA